MESFAYLNLRTDAEVQAALIDAIHTGKKIWGERAAGMTIEITPCDLSPGRIVVTNGSTQTCQ